ncbi:stalk domain-containing protein [Filifactor alocis]|uniref:stalk domain-containing protein n=1 Tax=Filifactor alocis TaxID=143361 RepID=UPI003FA01321
MDQSIKKKTNKQINIRKSVSFLMSMLMFLGMIPFSTGIAYAEERNGITSLDKLEAKEYIYMGVQGSGLQGAGKEIKWRILDKNANNGNTDGLFLLSEELLGSGSNGGVEYYKSFSFSRIKWKKSDAKEWCKKFSGETSGTKTSFDNRELDAILSTNKSDEKYIQTSGYEVVFEEENNILNGDKVFFLSAKEADKIYFKNMDERKAEYDGVAKGWWLRSSSSPNPGIVNENGELNTRSTDNPLPARPAFNLEKSKVMYISPAEDGKNKNEVGALEKVEPTNTTEWKLTLKDSARGSFTASKSKQDGMEVTINYDNAKTGENEYLSAVVTDELNTEIKYYGRIKHLKEDSDKEGIAKIDLNGKFENRDKLFVFNEQYNGDKKTDYSSDRKEIEGISVKKFYNVLLSVNDSTMGELTQASVPNVEDGTNITANKNQLTVGNDVVTANPKSGYRFKDWTGIPTNKKVTEHILVTAVFGPAPQPPQDKYTVTVKSNNETMGTVSKSKVENIAKDTMISKSGNELTVGTEKITATAKSGYRFKDWTGIPTNGTVTGNVAVTAVFEKKISGGKHSSDKDKDKRRYPIEKGKMNHGTITVESEGRYGEEITITAEPDRGYEVDKIKVTDDSGKDIEVTEKKGDKYTFSMPRRKVTVEATFKKIERPSNNNGQNPNDYMQKQKEVKTTVFTVGSNMVKYTVSGETQHASERQIDAKPFIRNGRVMVPIRYVAESLGMKVMWNKQSKIVTLQDKERKVEIVTNSKKIVVNGKEYVSDVAPVIENGRTYLSISNIGKVSGANMTWNNQSKQVSITK